MNVAGLAIGRLIGVLAAIVALILAVGLPLGYLTFTYRWQQGELHGHAVHAAETLNKYIATNPDAWEYQTHRLPLVLDVIGETLEYDHSIRVLNRAGGLVGERLQEPLPGPLLRAGATLYDFGVPVGRVELLRSLRPLAIQSGVVALLGLLLGLVVFFPLRAIPLRALGRAIDDLRKTTVSLDYLDNILHSMMDALLVVTPEGRIETANRAAARLLGYSESELAGRSMAGLIEEQGDCRLMEELLRNGSILDHELTYLGRDGRRIPVLFSGAVLRGGGGELHGFVCAAHDISERKEMEEGLRRSLRERETLLREVHHRVKNNLQVISSLLGMQSLGIPAARSALDESRDRVRSMALVHEKLYQSETLSEIDFADYLHGLTESVYGAHVAAGARIDLRFTLEPLALDIDTAIPCGLIVNELLSNAMKHAFRGRREGALEIGLRRLEGGGCELWVSDDGEGLPAGLDWRDAPSLGLRLVVNLAERQLAGRVEMESRGGTTFRVSLPPPASSAAERFGGDDEDE